MNRIRIGKQILTAALSVLLAAGSLPTAAYAGEQTAEKGLCEHHPEHTADCGYEEAQPCQHKHSEGCYGGDPVCDYIAEEEAMASESEAGHTHSQECYEPDCPHENGEHDTDCGYGAGNPCGYICKLCEAPANELKPETDDENRTAACALTEGCTLEDGHEDDCLTESLQSNVLIGGVNLLGASLRGANNPLTEEGITIRAGSTGAAVYTANKGFTLTKDGDYIISGRWMGTLDDGENVITIPMGIIANVTLDGLTITSVSQPSTCAFAVKGTAYITFFGSNSLSSGEKRGGLEVPENAEVVLTGSGSLNASGGTGIGGRCSDGSSDGENSGTIEINGGRITATSTGTGAGIGGGGLSSSDSKNGGSSGAIRISAGIVNAYGRYNGAGIGGGGSNAGIGGNNSNTEITGGTVNATGGGNGAGIGGGGSDTGSGGSNDALKISGGTVTAISTGRGAAIGGGGANEGEGGLGGSGGSISFSGSGTHVIADGGGSFDVGGGKGQEESKTGQVILLSVTDQATLEMKNSKTNAYNTNYKNCTINGSNGTTKYDENGNPIIPPSPAPKPQTSSSSSSGSSDGGSSYTDPDILLGRWIQTDTGTWMFRQTGGSYAKNRWGKVDGLWYFFDAEGRMLTGWQFINHQWYYLCTKEDLTAKAGMKEGAMVSGWHFDPACQKWFYLDKSGAMVTGWREIDGKWYYFNPVSDGTKGSMVTDCVIDGWYIGKDGVWTP